MNYIATALGFEPLNKHKSASVLSANATGRIGSVRTDPASGATKTNIFNFTGRSVKSLPEKTPIGFAWTQEHTANQGMKKSPSTSSTSSLGGSSRGSLNSANSTATNLTSSFQEGYFGRGGRRRRRSSHKARKTRRRKTRK